MPQALQRELEGAQRVADLTEELDFDIEYRPAHGHCLISTEEELEVFSNHRDQFVAAGLDERIISPAEFGEFEEQLHVPSKVIAVLQTDEAVVNPLRLVHGFWQAARRTGNAQLMTSSPVIGFDVSGRRVNRVKSIAGDVIADQIVIAAGPWTRKLALMLGVSLPTYYIQAEAVVTEPLPPLLNGFLYWGDLERIPAEARIAQESLAEGWESRGDETFFESYDFGTVQTKQGNLLLGQMTYVNPTFSSRVTHRVMPDSARETLRLFPQLGKARIIRSWRSPAPFTPDHLPLLGRLQSHDNVMVASGFQSALSGSPWAGTFVADLITGEPPAEDADVYDPHRFLGPVAV
jgi:glycine/D-amino acid oxidase-like deaminating enzyme